MLAELLEAGVGDRMHREVKRIVVESLIGEGQKIPLTSRLLDYPLL